MAILIISNPDAHGFIPAVMDVTDSSEAVAEAAETRRFIPVKLREDGATRWVNTAWISVIEPDSRLEQPDEEQDDDDQEDDSAADVHALGVPLNRLGLT